MWAGHAHIRSRRKCSSCQMSVAINRSAPMQKLGVSTTCVISLWWTCLLLSPGRTSRISWIRGVLAWYLMAVSYIVDFMGTWQRVPPSLGVWNAIKTPYSLMVISRWPWIPDRCWISNHLVDHSDWSFEPGMTIWPQNVHQCQQESLPWSMTLQNFAISMFTSYGLEHDSHQDPPSYS